MKTPRVWTDGVGYVHAGRYDGRNKGGTQGPMWRMRGRKLVEAPPHGIALHISMNAGSTVNLTKTSGTSRRLERSFGSQTVVPSSMRGKKETFVTGTPGTVESPTNVMVPTAAIASWLSVAAVALVPAVSVDFSAAGRFHSVRNATIGSTLDT